MVGYFNSNEWRNSGIGACDIATLIKRIIENYAKTNNIKPVNMGYQDGHRITKYGVFVVKWVDHADKQAKGLPADEIAVNVSNPNMPDPKSDTNLVIWLDPAVPETTEVKFLSENVKGYYRLAIQSNTDLGKMGVVVATTDI
jgi:hypothetical protein